MIKYIVWIPIIALIVFAFGLVVSLFVYPLMLVLFGFLFG